MKYMQFRGVIEEILPLVKKENIELQTVVLREGSPTDRNNVFKIDFINERVRIVSAISIGDSIVINCFVKASKKNDKHFLNIEGTDIIKL